MIAARLRVTQASLTSQPRPQTGIGVPPQVPQLEDNIQVVAQGQGVSLQLLFPVAEAPMIGQYLNITISAEMTEGTEVTRIAQNTQG